MVEIKELVVRAIVTEEASRASNAISPASATGSVSDEARAVLIEDCVRQVLAILERQNER